MMARARAMIPVTYPAEPVISKNQRLPKLRNSELPNCLGMRSQFDVPILMRVQCRIYQEHSMERVYIRKYQLDEHLH